MLQLKRGHANCSGTSTSSAFFVQVRPNSGRITSKSEVIHFRFLASGLPSVPCATSLVRRVGITVTYYFGCLLGSSRQAFGVELGQERVQVAAGESPLERRSRLLVMALESQKALFEFDQRGEVVWCEDFSLNDGEIDLNLIEPTEYVPMRLRSLMPLACTSCRTLSW